MDVREEQTRTGSHVCPVWLPADTITPDGPSHATRFASFDMLMMRQKLRDDPSCCCCCWCLTSQQKIAAPGANYSMWVRACVHMNNSWTLINA